MINKKIRKELKIMEVCTQMFDNDNNYIGEKYDYELYSTDLDHALVTAPTLEKLFRNILNGWAD